MHLDSKGRSIIIRNNYSTTITADLISVNQPLLFSLIYGGTDNDGYEYSYTIFDLIFDPRIIEKIAKVM